MKARLIFLCGSALAAIAGGPAAAQTTPGDLTGTPRDAGTGQSAVTATNAPAAAEAAPRRSEASASSDIIVTARRVEERLQDVPISITVFNQQQISNRNIINSQDIATYTPSLSTNSNFGTEFSSFAIRGFVQDPATAPSVGVYFADVVALRGPTQGTQAGDGAGPGSFFDLQNVQVLKGPQGTLFGRNTTGGAILFVPQKPTSRTEGFIEGSYGNYDMKRVQGAVNLPLSDIARLRIAGDYLNRDGWLKNIAGVGPGDLNDINYVALRGSLVVDLTPDLENYTIISYTRSNTNGSTKKAIACAPSLTLGRLLACPQIAREAGNGFYDVASVVPNPRSRLTSWQIINTTTWRAADTLTVKNITSYGQLSAFQRSSLFGTDWRFGIPALGLPVRQVTFATINPAPNRRTVDQSTFTEELQFQGTGLGDKLTWQAGGYLELSDPLGDVGNQSEFNIACANVNQLQCTDILGIAFSAASGFTRAIQVGASNYTVGETSYRNIGAYTQASYELSDKLKLTGGIRYTWDRQDNRSTRISYRFPVTPPFTQAVTGVCTDNLSIAYNPAVRNCASYTVQKSDKPTWLIDLDYKPVDDVLLYAKYARGYRAGGIGVNSPINFRKFGPEKVDSYEVGAKTSFRGAVSGTFNVSAFYNDFSNQQIQSGFNATPGAPVSSTAGPVNAGRSRIYGVEVETSVSPFRGFSVDAAYTYLNARIRRIDEIISTDPNYIASAAIRAGDPLPLSPKHKVSATASYTLPLDEAVGRVTLAATYTYVDKQLSTYLYRNNAAIRAAFGGQQLGTVPSYDLLNLNLEWKGIAGAPVDASVFATNVTGKKYITYVGGVGGAGFETAVLGEPRMYGVRLRYRFGR